MTDYIAAERFEFYQNEHTREHEIIKGRVATLETKADKMWGTLFGNGAIGWDELFREMNKRLIAIETYIARQEVKEEEKKQDAKKETKQWVYFAVTTAVITVVNLAITLWVK